ncbi:hypothetical protein D1872_286720 [compost metagenome]
MLPSPLICEVTLELEPLPMATIAMTALTPMIIPSIVRKERSLFDRMLRTETRIISIMFISVQPPIQREYD